MSEQNVVDTPSEFETEEFYGDGNDSEVGQGGTAAPGMGQSKSSRRRRRKRKNKVMGGDGAAPAGEAAQPTTVPGTIVMEGESLALAAGAAPPQRKQQSGGGQQHQGNGQQQGAGGKRWKKKFRDRERRPGRNENPGNDFRAEAGNGFGGGGSNNGGYRPDNFGNGNGGFKRKNKGGGQSRERAGFVGPMDHSYREVNGNFAEAPPATIQVHGSHGRRGGHRHHGDNQPIDYNMPRPIPIPEGAQTHIYFFIEELFFIAKIQETARKLGVKVAFMKNDKDAIAEMLDAEENKPALIVFDLNNANAKPLTLIPKLKVKLKRSASIVGFLSHLQGDLKAKAVEAGCDVVMPRAAFSQNLPNLLRRYGAEEENEVNFNY
jgi:hypothetical protein